MREAVGSSPSGSTTSLRTAYRSQRLFCKSHFSLILSQLLSESNPLSLGFDSVFYSDWGIFFCQCVPRRRGLRIVRDGVFLFKANAVSHSLRRSSFPRKADGFAGTPNTGRTSLAACIFCKSYRRAHSAASPFPKKVALHLRRSLVNARAPLRHTSLFRGTRIQLSPVKSENIFS